MEIRSIADVRTPEGSVPAIQFIPDPVRGAALLLHPYGGCKQQMLWLAHELGLLGISALAVDLSGHGDNRLEAGPRMLDDMETALDFLRRDFEFVGCAGGGLGGRLALMSSADFMAAISPTVFCERAPGGGLEKLPYPSVREPYEGYLPTLLRELGPVAPCERPCLLLYAEHDVPELVRSRSELKQALLHADIRYIPNRMWPDFAHDGEAQSLIAWSNHREMLANAGAVEITARWLAQMPAILSAARRVHAE